MGENLSVRNGMLKHSILLLKIKVFDVGQKLIGCIMKYDNIRFVPRWSRNMTAIVFFAGTQCCVVHGISDKNHFVHKDCLYGYFIIHL